MAKKKAGENSATQEVARPQIAGSQIAGFPVVGIGASAGGLEALVELLDNMPADTGMAFVVVTHQHPGHTSLLPELLGKDTEMPVVAATDGTTLEPNHVYVASPGGHLAILNGTLHRMETENREAPRLPIDYFFRSLAEDQRERAICIVLSGTGTDGTLGLKAIKGESGMAMVQEPQSAKYAGMPSSAAGTGLADYVLPAAAMPNQLVAYASGPYLTDHAMVAQSPVMPAEPMQKIFVLLRNRTGHDFSAYKENTIRRRIERRMNVHQIDEPGEYVRYLQENDHEIDTLFKELLISVTSFFRDPEAWEVLAAEPMAELLKSRPDNYSIRAWVPACASGEEVFTLAIVLHECMEKARRHFDVQIFGTDLDSEAVDAARIGQYPSGIGVDVSPARLERYFTHQDSTYRIRKEIREMAIFAPQNVIKDPPLTFVNIKDLKDAEKSSKMRTYFEAIFETVRQPLLVLDEQRSVVSANRCFFETFRLRPSRFKECRSGNWAKVPGTFRNCVSCWKKSCRKTRRWRITKSRMSSPGSVVRCFCSMHVASKQTPPCPL